jgi:hypothetical protein
MLSYLIWLHADSIGKAGTYTDKGYNISVESSYRKYTGSVDWANYIPRCGKKVSLANEIATMGTKCKIKRHPEMRRTPGLAALVFVVWVPLLFNGFSICSENKTK